jgi:AraC-like DNA-binding protein
MVVNDNAGGLIPRGVLASIASELAPTGDGGACGSAGLIGRLIQARAPIRRYLTQNLNLSHSLNSLAERVHMIPRNLSRLFSRETGLSPMASLNNARVEPARRHPENSTLPSGG